MADNYYNTRETVSEYIKLADGYNGQVLIDKLKPFLTAKSSVLEIGSGPGSDWEILSQTYEVTGSDNSSEFLHHLKTKYPSGDFLLLDASNLETNNKYDSIYSNKVMHHLTDDELSHSIKRQSELLNSGGIICHSFWKGEGSEVFKGLFVNYHDEEAIKSAFKTQFIIISLEAYEEFEPEDSLLLIAQKK